MRELARGELEVLREPRPKTPVAKRFRDSHHRVARLFASGHKAKAINALTGYSLNRLSMFEADPAFAQLIASYRDSVDESWRESIDEYHALATSNMLKAERQLEAKLDEADDLGETLPTRDLIAIARDAADRFGYSKHTINTNLNVDFASKLDAAIARSAKVIDITSAAGRAAASLRPRPNLPPASSTRRGPVAEGEVLPTSASPPLIRRRV